MEMKWLGILVLVAFIVFVWNRFTAPKKKPTGTPPKPTDPPRPPKHD